MLKIVVIFPSYLSVYYFNSRAIRSFNRSVALASFVRLRGSLSPTLAIIQTRAKAGISSKNRGTHRMISLNDATVYIEAGHSCEWGYRIPLSESPSLFSSLFLSLSLSFPQTYGNPRTIVSPSFEKPARSFIATLVRRHFFASRKPINSIQYFAFPEFFRIRLISDVN